MSFTNSKQIDSLITDALFYYNYLSGDKETNSQKIAACLEENTASSHKYFSCTAQGHKDALQFVGYADPKLVGSLKLPRLFLPPLATNLLSSQPLDRYIDHLYGLSGIDEATKLIKFWEQMEKAGTEQGAEDFELMLKVSNGALFSPFAKMPTKIGTSNYYKQWDFSVSSTTISEYLIEAATPPRGSVAFPDRTDIAALKKHRAELVRRLIEELKPVIEANGNNPFLWWQVAEKLTQKVGIEVNTSNNLELWLAIGSALHNIPATPENAYLKEFFGLEYKSMTDSLTYEDLQCQRRNLGADSIEGMAKKAAADIKYSLLWSRVWRHFVVRQASRYSVDSRYVKEAETEYLEVTKAAKKARLESATWPVELELHLHALADHLSSWSQSGGPLTKILFENPAKIVDLEGALARIKELEGFAQHAESFAAGLKTQPANVRELIALIYFESFVASYFSVGLFETGLKNMQNLSRFYDTKAFKIAIDDLHSKWPWLVTQEGEVTLKDVDYAMATAAATQTSSLFLQTKSALVNNLSQTVPILLCSYFGPAASAGCGAAGKVVLQTYNKADPEAKRLIQESNATGVSLISENFADKARLSDAIDWAMIYPYARLGWTINRAIVSLGGAGLSAGANLLMKTFGRGAAVRGLASLNAIIHPIATASKIGAELAEKGVVKAASQTGLGFVLKNIANAEFRAVIGTHLGGSLGILTKSAGAALAGYDIFDEDGLGSASGMTGLALLFGPKGLKLLKATGKFLVDDWNRKWAAAGAEAVKKGLVADGFNGMIPATLARQAFLNGDREALGVFYHAAGGYVRMGAGVSMMLADYADDGELNSILASFGVGLIINEVYGNYVMGWNANGGMMSLLGMFLLENGMLVAQNFPFTAPPFAYMFVALATSFTIRGLNKQFVYGVPNVGKSFLFKNIAPFLAKHNVRIPISVVGRKFLPSRRGMGVMNAHEVPSAATGTVLKHEHALVAAANGKTLVPDTTVGTTRFTTKQLEFYEKALLRTSGKGQRFPKMLKDLGMSETALRSKYQLTGDVRYFASGKRVAVVPQNGENFYVFKLKKSGVLYCEELPKNIVALHRGAENDLIRVIRHQAPMQNAKGELVPVAKVVPVKLDSSNSFSEGQKRYLINIDPEGAPNKLDVFLSNTTYPTHADRPFHKNVRALISPFRRTKTGNAVYNFWETRIGSVATNAARSSSVNRMRGSLAQSELLPMIYQVRFAAAYLQDAEPNETASAAAAGAAMAQWFYYTYIQMPMVIDSAKASLAGYFAGTIVNAVFFADIFPSKKREIPYFDNDTFISDSFLKRLAEGKYQEASDRMFRNLTSLNWSHHFLDLPFNLGFSDEPIAQLNSSNRQLEPKRVEAYRKKLLEMTKAANKSLHNVEFTADKKAIETLKELGAERFEEAIAAFMFTDSVLQRAIDLAAQLERGEKADLDRMKMLIIDIAMLKIFARNKNFTSVNWYYKEALAVIEPLLMHIPNLSNTTNLRHLGIDLDAGRISTELLELERVYEESVGHMASDIMELAPIFNSTDK